ncbi:MAG: hypothetical protein FJX59_03750 [Alphaproteobacteria bacterium]|nr:hypothetical protein [Alphaproteobacteria bacterium]
MDEKSTKSGAAPITTEIESQYGEFLWVVNKLVLDPETRDKIGDKIAGMINASCGFAVNLVGDEIVAALAAALKTEGVAFFPAPLTPHERDEVRVYFESSNDRVQNNSVLNYSAAAVMKAPHLWRLTTDPTLLEAIQVYLGAPPTLVDVSAWWAMPQTAQAWGAQIYHRDVNDFRSCKLFYYLTDCGPDDGPHVFVKRSHDPAHVMSRLVAAGMDPAQRHGLFAGSGRHLAPHIETVFGPDVTEITGQAGTCFVENTYGFHRAKVPTRQPRLLVQALYSLIDYPHRTKIFEAHRLAAMPAAIAQSPLARYAMRMMVR